MNIKFLGTGGAFDFEKGTSAAIVNIAGKNILIDCGFSTILKLAEKDLAKNIDYILITHLHGDHVGSLPTLLQYIKHRVQTPIPKIITPNDSFRAELKIFFESTFVTKYVDFVDISKFPEIGCIDTSGQHVPDMSGFSYYFLENDHLLYYSGDIGNADVAQKFLEGRKESSIQVFHETSPQLDLSLHASYLEVQEKLGDYETYMYHIAKENMPNDCTLTYVEDCPELLA